MHLRLRKIFNSDGILDLSCRMDLFKRSPRYWWRHIDDDVTQECNITYFSFQLLISMPGRGDSLPRNTREVFPGGLSNPFPAKIGLRIQRRHSGGLKVPGTPLNFDFKISEFGFLTSFGQVMWIFAIFSTFHSEQTTFILLLIRNMIRWNHNHLVLLLCDMG